MTRPIPLLNNDVRPPPNSFVVLDRKIVYMSVTKVACTSLRWMIADLAGENLESFYGTLEAQQSRLMTVHRNRDHWQHAPQLGQLSERRLSEISRDNGWFIFAVVRDPWTRLWSAWQSKFLVRHQLYYDRFSTEPWFPRVPEKSQDVIDDFKKFVDARPWQHNPQLTDNVHFKPQVFSVRPHLVNYTKVYDLHDLSTLFADLHTHLKAIGKDKELYVPRANDTPLPLIPAVLENGVAEQIEDAYREDFEIYGERWSLDTIKMQDSWTADAIRHAAYHTVANQRIGDMRNAARQMRRELKNAQGRVRLLEARVSNESAASTRSTSIGETATRVARKVVRRARAWQRNRKA
jgi:hypothetical protein